MSSRRANEAAQSASLLRGNSSSSLGAERGHNTTHSLSATGSSNRRAADLAAAFDSDEEEQEEAGETTPRATQASIASSSPPGYSASAAAASNADVFFDAGDAMSTQPTHTSDPLNASRLNGLPPNGPRRGYTASVLPVTPLALGVAPPSPDADAATYDFERPTYFATSSGASAPTTPSRSRAASLGGAGPSGSTYDLSGAETHAGSSTGFAAGSGGLGPEGAAPGGTLARARLVLGRFGRFVGMRLPGATYASLSQDEGGAPGTAGQPARRRVVGGGMGDGVFANLSAKPERRRRPQGGEDRGEDDDLVDDVLPPTYDIAAADSAPPYWETTIIGGGLHPLAPGGLGWTPGGATVGAIEDLIVDGLPVGNFFGFAWNLLVSVSFQFVGFLLTYLLHTTHAARCGSRAGLGITLVQYGFFLRTRSIQEGKSDDAPVGGGGGTTVEVSADHWWPDLAGQATRSLVTRAVELVMRQDSNNGTLADALAANAEQGHEVPDGGVGAQLFPVEASTEWLAYLLMVIGWFMLLSSLLSYWRVHRWGRQLVAAAHRDAADTEATNADADAREPDGSQPVGFIHTLRQAFAEAHASASATAAARHGRATGTGEDWLIFPGALNRLRHSTSGAQAARNADEAAIYELQDHDDSDSDDDAPSRRNAGSGESHMSPEERRLMSDMRTAGLI